MVERTLRVRCSIALIDGCFRSPQFPADIAYYRAGMIRVIKSRLSRPSYLRFFRLEYPNRCTEITPGRDTPG